MSVVVVVVGLGDGIPMLGRYDHGLHNNSASLNHCNNDCSNNKDFCVGSCGGGCNSVTISIMNQCNTSHSDKNDDEAAISMCINRIDIVASSSPRCCCTAGSGGGGCCFCRNS